MERLAQWTDWLWSPVAVMSAAIVGLGLHSVAFAILNHFSRRTTSSLDDSLCAMPKARFGQSCRCERFAGKVSGELAKDES
jgi:hypothetical protein